MDQINPQTDQYQQTENPVQPASKFSVKRIGTLIALVVFLSLISFILGMKYQKTVQFPSNQSPNPSVTSYQSIPQAPPQGTTNSFSYIHKDKSTHMIKFSSSTTPLSDEDKQNLINTIGKTVFGYIDPICDTNNPLRGVESAILDKSYTHYTCGGRCEGFVIDEDRKIVTFQAACTTNSDPEPESCPTGYVNVCEGGLCECQEGSPQAKYGSYENWPIENTCWPGPQPVTPEWKVVKDMGDFTFIYENIATGEMFRGTENMCE